MDDFPPLVVVHDKPEPGMPTVVVRLPEVLIVCLNPRGPNDTLALPLLRFTRTPGKIFLVRLKRNPILNPPNLRFSLR